MVFNPSNENKPLISVLMSVFNGQRWLKDSVQSVLNQSYQNFEFLIIDDGSIDLSLDIIKHFAKSDSRVRFFKKTNSGLTKSLNYGLHHARGTWVARIDVDDIWFPEKLKKQIEKINQFENINLVGTGLVLINEENKIVKTYNYPSTHLKLIKHLTRGMSFFPHSSAFFKLSEALLIGGYRERFINSQDVDLWIRLSEIGTISCINESLVYIRKHKKQISYIANEKQFLYSNLAIISKKLRIKKTFDPIESPDQRVFEEFKKFSFRKLRDLNHNVYLTKLNKIKNEIDRNKKIRNVIFILIKCSLISPIFFIQFLKYKFFGYNFSSKIAKEWILLKND